MDNKVGDILCPEREEQSMEVQKMFHKEHFLPLVGSIKCLDTFELKMTRLMMTFDPSLQTHGA